MINLTAIAAKFNVLEIAITRAEEWANCVFVVIKGIGARFVSKAVGITAGLNLDLPDSYFTGTFPKRQISKKVWDSFTANEQDLIAILSRRQDLNPIKSFIKGMRARFGGVENVIIVQMGKVIDPKTPDQIHLWDGEDKKWYSFPRKN